MVHKIKRTFTSVLPVSDRREGRCRHCGACCRLPFECPMLIRKDDGSHYCAIYPVRFLNCRKYPRAESEFLTKNTCGYRFSDDDE